MKKILVCWFLLLIIAGCGLLQNKREFKQDIFSTVYPDLTLKMNELFLFEEQQESTKSIFFTTAPESSGNVSQELFFFVNERKSRGIAIEFSTLNRGFWILDSISGVDNLIDSGTEKQSGITYQYNIFTYSTKEDRCFLSKRFARKTGGGGNILVAISYFQELPETAAPCDQWHEMNTLDEEQKKRLSQFLADCAADMQFME